jgi:hypothetical protein
MARGSILTWISQMRCLTMWCNAQGFGPGHKEVMRVGGIPKLVALLGSSSETVKERAIEALLVS